MKAEFNPLLDQGGAMNVICGTDSTLIRASLHPFSKFIHKETGMIFRIIFVDLF